MLKENGAVATFLGYLKMRRFGENIWWQWPNLCFLLHFGCMLICMFIYSTKMVCECVNAVMCMIDGCRAKRPLQLHFLTSKIHINMKFICHCILMRLFYVRRGDCI